MTKVDFKSFTADDVQEALMSWAHGSAGTTLKELEEML